jgi:protein TonB
LTGCFLGSCRYRSLVRQLADASRRQSPDAVELTSRPVAVKNIWDGYRFGKQAGACSVLIHTGIVAVLVLLAGGGPSTSARRPLRLIGRVVFAPDPAVRTLAPPSPDAGGGGGNNSLLPASWGQLPRFAERQLVPPSAVETDEAAALPVIPTLVGSADVEILDNPNAPRWGDPLSKARWPSDGPGEDGGMGTGKRHGVGARDGPRIGAGSGPGYYNVYVPGRGGVSAPIPIYKVEPEYSEEARKAKFQGTVVLSIVVDEQGMPTNFQVVTPLGLGLDEKAVEAVTRWRFRPGMKDGKPVAVFAKIYVTFRLL